MALHPLAFKTHSGSGEGGHCWCQQTSEPACACTHAKNVAAVTWIRIHGKQGRIERNCCFATPAECAGLGPLVLLLTHGLLSISVPLNLCRLHAGGQGERTDQDARGEELISVAKRL